MKKVFITIIAMLLPMLAIGQVLLYENDFTTAREFTGWSQFDDIQTDGKVELTADGLAITVGIQTGQLWQPQVMVIPDGSFNLDEGGDYQVVVTAKFPGAGTLQMNMGTWSANDQALFSVGASNNFQTIVCEFPNWSVDANGAHLLFQCGDFRGTTILKKIQVFKLESGLNYNYNTVDKTAEVISRAGVKYYGNVVIPSKVIYAGIEYSVTKIGSSAFEGCIDMTSVTIPSSVTTIGGAAFYYCTGLTTVDIPNGVKTIGEGAFSKCGGLTSVTIPGSVTSIGKNAFFQCYGITQITSGIENPFAIDDGVFPSSVYTNASLLVPSGKKSVYQNIAGWKRFQNIVEPGVAVKEFEAYGIRYLIGENNTVSVTSKTGKYTGAVVISSQVTYNGKNYTVTSIGSSAFEGCTGMTSVTIPSSVTTIGGAAFYMCTGLTTVDIPNGVKTIGEGAFSKCESLTSVTIPGSVTSIGKNAFFQCYGLTQITSGIENPFAIDDGVFPTSVYNNASLLVPSGRKSAYQNTAGWKRFLNIIDPSVVVKEFEDNGIRYLIGENNTVSVTSKTEKYTGAVSIPSQVYYGGNNYTVTSISSSAFEGCIDITSVIIPSSVTTIGDAAFYMCTGLTTVDIPNGVKTIGEGAFSKCEGLTSVTIPGSVTSIGKNAFFQCYGLTQITSGIENPFAIDDGVFPTSVYNNASLLVPSGRKSAYQNTAGWKRFQNIIDPSVVGKEFEDNGIRYLIGENNTVSVISKTEKYAGAISIPSQVYFDGNNYTVISIGSSAFEGCTDMTSVTIPSSVTTIGGAAFYYCIGMITVDIPNGVKTIGEGAFSKCEGLTLVTIPGSVTSIGKNAFFQCYGLTQITSGIENPFAIDDGVFPTSVYNNTPLLVPSGKMSAYQNTAGWKRFQNIVEVLFSIDGITYQGSKSEKNLVVKSVDTSKTWMEIPASVIYDGITYQVTGINNDVFKGNSMAALIWNVEAVLPINAFSTSIGSNFLLYVKSSSYAPSSVKNVVADGTAQTILLSDDGGQFYCPQAFTARSISYTHNYSMETGGNGKGWESLALPFSVQKISHNTRGEIVPFALYSSGSSQKPFWLAKFSGNEFERTSAIEANEPYIIAMPNNKNYRNDYNLAGEVTFSAENAAVPKTPAFGGAFVPAFTPVTMSSSVKALNNISYTGGYDPGSCFIPNLRDVHPFEAYMTGNSSRGIIEINYDNGTTDMFDILFSTDDGEEVTIYTLGGLQVSHTTQRDFDAVWQQLPKGIYLVNGNKRIR